MDKTAFFLGAGFSKWSSNLPLAFELFDFDIEPTSKLEERRLAKIKIDWGNWEEANGPDTAEQFVYWALNKSSHRSSRVIWYICRRLSDPFMTKIEGSFSPLMFDERRSKDHKGVAKARSLITTVKKISLTGILTCNYDTLIECALGTDGFNYGTPNERLQGRGHNPQFPYQFAHRTVTGDIRLAKLHGSLSWDRSFKHTSGKPGRAGKAFIVPTRTRENPAS